MRKLVYLVASSLDGFVADPTGGDPTAPDGFWPIGEDYVRHLVSEFPETLPGAARRALGITGGGRCFDTVLEGRKSYELGLRAGVADAYPHLRHIVFSRTIAPADPSVQVVSDDPVSTVRTLKEQEGKDIWLVGGGHLAGTLRAEIDRLVLKVAPLTLGVGVPLFGRDTEFEPEHWTLTEHVALRGGTLVATYDRART